MLPHGSTSAALLREGVRESRPAAGSASLLKTVFNELDNKGIRYIVLRNYEGYPHQITGDVDIVISPREAGRVRQIFKATVDRSGWHIVRDVTHSFLHGYVLVNPTANASSRAFLAFDFFLGLTWNGLPYFDFEDVWRTRVRHGFIWVPSFSRGAWVTALHYLLYNGHVPDRYRGRLTAALLGESTLSDPPPSFIDHPLVAAVACCLREGKWTQLCTYGSALRWSLVRNHFSRAPFVTLSRILRLVAGYWGVAVAGRRLPLLLLTSDDSADPGMLRRLAESTYEVIRKYHLAGGHFAIIPFERLGWCERALGIGLGLAAGGVMYTARPLRMQPWIFRATVGRKACTVHVAGREGEAESVAVCSMGPFAERPTATVLPRGCGGEAVAEAIVRILACRLACPQEAML